MFVSSSYADSYRGGGSETLTPSSGGEDAAVNFLGCVQRGMRLEGRRSTRCSPKLEGLMLRTRGEPLPGSGCFTRHIPGGGVVGTSTRSAQGRSLMAARDGVRCASEFLRISKMMEHAALPP